MKAKQLMEAFSHIDDRHLETAERTARRGRTAFCTAACLCAAAAALVFMLAYPSPVPIEDAVSTEAQTSEKYADLDALIKALSRGENHDSKDSEGVRSSSEIGASGIGEADTAVSFGEYTYSVSEDFTLIVTDYTGAAVCEFGEAQYVMLAGDRLVTAMPFMSGGTEFDYEKSVAIEIYSLADPARPLLERRITQRGNLVACYESRGQILVLTEDGECACGASVRDKETFIPLMTVVDEPLEWTDDEISILGEPQSVRYLAVSSIDPSVGEVTVRHAYYGDIESVFYGEGWMAITTAVSGSGGVVHPEVYTFDYDNGFVFTGKLSTAAIFSLPESVGTGLLGGLRDGTYPTVSSITKAGGEYRVIGELAVVDGGSVSTEMFALRVDMQAQTHTAVRTKHSDGEQFSIAEILWEEDRAIIGITITFVTDTDIYNENRFVFAEFSPEGITFFENDLRFDEVAGIDMIYWQSRPLGDIESLIPFGNGIYLRYNGIPNGLDIYDFSSSAAPVCLYSSPRSTAEEYRYDFVNAVYDDNTIGVVKISPNEEGEYRDTTLTWCVFSVDITADEPFTLLSETPYRGAEAG